MVAKGGLVLTSLLTFGLNLMLVNIVLLIWQADFRATNPWYMTMSFEFAGATISYVRLTTFFIALLLTICLELFFRKTEQEMPSEPRHSIRRQPNSWALILRILTLSRLLSVQVWAGQWERSIFSISPFLPLPEGISW